MSNPDGADHEAFDHLGHEIRLAIVERLAEERRTNWRPSGLEFAELRKAVDVSDPGQFNYHLDKFVETFVTHDDEYVLTTAGVEVAGTVRAGTYDAADVSFDAPARATSTSGRQRPSPTTHSPTRTGSTTPPSRCSSSSSAATAACSSGRQRARPSPGIPPSSRSTTTTA